MIRRHTAAVVDRPAPADVPVPLPVLAAVDVHRERCDACGHRAYVVTAIDTGKDRPSLLSWCGHHFALNEATLAACETMLGLVDRRDLLTVRETGVHA